MSKRAFIIAIENYAQMSDALAPTLPGTYQAAAVFRNWLIQDQGLAATDIFFCCDGAVAGRTAGADRDDIVGELMRLKNEGKDQTDGLYFLYCGHGFSYTDVDGARMADVLVAADFKERGISGNACLNLDEIQRWLKTCLGPHDHFYFIDACRNQTSEKQVKVGSLGLTYDPSTLGIPTLYTLYSTVEGGLSAVNSGFIGVLVDALKGRGRAKVWRGANMAVLFRSVKEYVESQLTGQQIDERKEGSRDGLIREISPPPTYACQIQITNAAAADQFTVGVSTARNQRVATITFVGPTGSFTQPPDDYNLRVKLDDSEVVPLDPVPTDLYEDRTVRFEKRVPMTGPRGPSPTTDAGAGDPSGEGPGSVAVTIHSPNFANVVLRNLRGDAKITRGGTFTETMAHGRYDVSTVDYRGSVVSQRTIDLTGTAGVEIDLAGFRQTPLRDSLLGGIAGYHDRGAIDFSETLGPTPDQGMDLWLAVVGASRIVARPGNFSKLGPLPLASFEDERVDAAPIYLLAGFDVMPASFAVGISQGPEVSLENLVPHPKFPGLFEWRSRTSAPGPYLLSLKIGDNASSTCAVCGLPNRVTLVTVSSDARGAVRIQQFMLPIFSLVKHLPLDVPSFFLPGSSHEDLSTPLRAVRLMVEIQRWFANSEDFKPNLSIRKLDNLLDMKWFEPIIALLAAYELARRGEVKALPAVVKKLRQHLREIADVEALAKMAGLPFTMPSTLPIVLDGLLAINMPAASLPFPPEALDFRGPWTIWKGTASKAQLSTASMTASLDEVGGTASNRFEIGH